MKLFIKLYALTFLPFCAIAQNPIRDTTFSFDGHVRTSIGPSSESAVSVVVQADGKIIAAGTQADNAMFGPHHFALVRYQTNGDLDSTFGVNGKAVNGFQSNNYLNTITLQPDGKILAGGQMSSGMGIARYLTDGSVDSTFGTNGFTVVNSTVSSAINNIKILSNGKIITSGSSQIPFSTNFELKLAQFNSNGIIDSTFGVNGIVFPPTGFISTGGGKLLVEPGGKLVIGGRYIVNTGPPAVAEVFLMRLFDTGAIDSSFGTNGIATYTTALGINDMSFDNNGNIVAVGNVGTNQQGTAGDVVVMRFDANGITDSTFGTNGSTSVSVDSYADYANAVLLQGDGKILLGGSYFNFAGGSVTDCLLLRFTDTGLRDTTFGVNGVFKTGVCSGTDRILDMAMTADNRIVVSGEGNYGTDFDFVVGRIITDQTNTGIEAVESKSNQLVVYPNPAGDMLKVEIALKQALPVTIKVYDITNRLVKTICEKKVIAAGGHIEQLNTAALSRGVYTLVAVTGNEMQAAKFIKY